jgi:hypothetical protein
MSRDDSDRIPISLFKISTILLAATNRGALINGQAVEGALEAEAEAKSALEAEAKSALEAEAQSALGAKGAAKKAGEIKQNSTELQGFLQYLDKSPVFDIQILKGIDNVINTSETLEMLKHNLHDGFGITIDTDSNSISIKL